MILYNDTDSFVAQWSRNLIVAGHLPSGVVDERSIEDLDIPTCPRPTQCHFFAGIGGWAYALKLAGWPHDQEVWTGSCPCQPFSVAGKKKGQKDSRHLWPAWFRLINKHRPSVIFGEQVTSPDGLKWLDLVSSDLEGAGYSFGAANLCAAGVGAPHIRQRLYFVAIDRPMANTMFSGRFEGRCPPAGDRVRERIGYPARSSWRRGRRLRRERPAEHRSSS